MVDGFKVSFSRDIGKFAKGLEDIKQKQFPFAAARALTQTAQAVKEAERQKMQSVFDRPTRFALNSLYVKPATKNRLYANVFFREFASKGTPAVKYLGPEVYGGKRRVKRFERAMQMAGKLPKNMAVVPGKGARVNSYGNMSPGQITQILSDLRASSDATQNRGDGKRAKYFVGKPGNGPMGVWMRKGRKARDITPVMLFIEVPSYNKLLPFYETAVRVSREVFEPKFRKSLDDAIRTAK
ncbi:hypothetical protein [Ferrovibrio xuzhouensis]|uniref:Phage protein, HK97 gp10 family n=1 Tax=Ferrovibrio xuzhouensis TaxID=1576914 RepID=A0ABV7VB56_9PROT